MPEFILLIILNTPHRIRTIIIFATIIYLYLQGYAFAALNRTDKTILMITPLTVISGGVCSTEFRSCLINIILYYYLAKRSEKGSILTVTKLLYGE
jgi:hypothetical protein